MSDSFSHLFSPGKIGKLALKNRIVMPPMVMMHADPDGSVSQQQIDYYSARANGEAAMIVVEAAYPRPGGYPNRISLGDDKFIPGLAKLAKSIKEGGAKAVIEINPHRGRSDEVDPASASDMPHPITGIRPRVITAADISMILSQFEAGVRRVVSAGFDGIMIHGGHGYLVHEFLSPLTNKRTDDYGGTPEQRARLALALVKSIQDNSPAGYPIIFRLVAEEKMKGGVTLADSTYTCKMLEAAGVDAIDVVAGGAEAKYWSVPYMYFPRACNADLAGEIRKSIRIPVLVAGRINDPEVAEVVLARGQADFVDIGRGLIADPDFPIKTRQGRLDDICKCIGCLRCVECIESHSPVVCSVNPAVGRERGFVLSRVAKPKKVLVIGGGPAGMEAALIADKRGHHVTLWEKEAELGGQLRIAVAPPDKDELGNLTQYLRAQLGKSGVKVELKKQGSAKAVRDFNADTVVLAVGSIPRIPKVKGISGPNVYTNTAVLSGKANVGKRVLVMGANFIGCETAEFLSGKGRTVTLFRRTDKIAGDVIPFYRQVILDRLKERGVSTLVGATDEEVTKEGLKITNNEGETVMLQADSIVLATGSVPDRSLPEELGGDKRMVIEVGDCVEPRRILEAIHEGANAAMRI